MYAGFISHKHTWPQIGAHQKFDRMAHRAVQTHTDSFFPHVKTIQKFEGLNGPDGIKIKSPGKHEPWHYYDPTDPEDNELVILLEQHGKALKQALMDKNEERSAFEAAWLAHGITDGLTPAHHYPYTEVLESIIGTKQEDRTTKASKFMVLGGNGRETVGKNWQLWGTKGLMTTHHTFETGVAFIMLPMSLKHGEVTEKEVKKARKDGIAKTFKQAAEEVYKLHMFTRFYKKGWNIGLAHDAKRELVPKIAKTIALAWLICAPEDQK